MSNYHPEDRPDPAEQPIQARVPEHISRGAFSTGVIVMTAHTEFILDFVQNLGRPHQIVARVVMPHHVLPQFVDALHRNMELYRNRWGELPHTGKPIVNSPGEQAFPNAANHVDQPQAAQQAGGGGVPDTGGAGASGAGNSGAGNSGAGNSGHGGSSGTHGAGPAEGSNLPPAGSGARQASAQEIYDDLKIRDELLSGAYANAVMIGHGPHEFSFDFISNFYPRSAVSARVFLAAGQVPRLYDSLRGTWDQLRNRPQPPTGPAGGAPPPPTGSV